MFRGSEPEARKVDGGFVLNGQKIFITNAGLGAILLIVADAVDDDDASGSRCLPPAATLQACSYGPRARTMGWRASTNAEVFIDDVFVPDDDVIGAVGTGFAGAVRTFELSRIEVAACSIGVARGLAGIRPRLRQPARGVRSSHRPLPGSQLSVGRRRDTPACVAALDVGCGARRRPRRAVRYQGVDGQALRFRDAVATTSQAMQVLGGHGYVEDHPDREVVPRRPPGDHRRRHQRDPTRHHRSRPARLDHTSLLTTNEGPNHGKTVGTVTIAEQLCKGCDLCVVVCPEHVLAMTPS